MKQEPILGHHDFQRMPTAKGVRSCTKCGRREIKEPGRAARYEAGRGYTTVLIYFAGACEPVLEART